MGDKTPATTTQNQSTTSTTDPWSTATPLLQGLISSYGNQSTTPTTAQTDATGNLVSSAAGIPNLTAPATTSIDQLFQNSGLLNSNYNTLQGNIGATASGANLNPYSTPGFSDALGTMTQDITNATKGVYAGSGRDPSGAGSFSQSLGRGLTQGLAPIIQSQYNTNEQNMLGANNTLYNAGLSTVGGLDSNTMAALSGAGALPGIATGAATAQLGAANAQQALPYQNLLEQLQAAGMLGGMGSSSTSTGTATGTQTPANNPLSNWLGGITAGAGLLGAGGSNGIAGSLMPLLLASDPKLKTDKKKVGKLDDGQNVWEFRFKGRPEKYVGLMADEVEKKRPEAVYTDHKGTKFVDYRAATRFAGAGMAKVA